MNYRKLANIKVSAIGMGCMGFSHGYGQPPEHNESLRLIRYAHDLGCTHFDTAEGYGAGHNEELVGQALKPVRQKVVLATKFYIADSAGR
ncbi:aldo/keto reductase, partial [Klebsiella pneumoniae]|uniref:aldo/keto reductase n=1 Tax=Klebsiella pneumoniae TaxID=573 RepID=UPI003969C43E